MGPRSHLCSTRLSPHVLHGRLLHRKINHQIHLQTPTYQMESPCQCSCHGLLSTVEASPHHHPTYSRYHRNWLSLLIHPRTPCPNHGNLDQDCQPSPVLYLHRLGILPRHNRQQTQPSQIRKDFVPHPPPPHKLFSTILPLSNPPRHQSRQQTQ